MRPSTFSWPSRAGRSIRPWKSSAARKGSPKIDPNYHRSLAPEKPRKTPEYDANPTTPVRKAPNTQIRHRRRAAHHDTNTVAYPSSLSPHSVYAKNEVYDENGHLLRSQSGHVPENPTIPIRPFLRRQFGRQQPSSISCIFFRFHMGMASFSTHS